MQPLTILLVEDNADDEVLALRALTRTSIRSNIVVVRDGEEAMDYIFGQGKYRGRDTRLQPHVTFMDIKLPKLSGLEVLKAIRSDERTRLLPVVVLTSSDEPADVLEAYRLGANSYIKKPVDFNEFVRQVKLLGEYWLSINRSPQALLH